MESFIRLDVGQPKSKISLHLDAYMRKTLDNYQARQGTKIPRPNSMPLQLEYCMYFQVH